MFRSWDALPSWPRPYQNQNRRRGWTSASCTQTPPAWWPHSDRLVGGPSGCSHRPPVGGWSAGRRIAASPLASAGWRGGGCAWRRPESGGCPPTCSRWSWPGRGCRGSSAHRLGEARGTEGWEGKNSCYFQSVQSDHQCGQCRFLVVIIVIMCGKSALRQCIRPHSS